MRKNLVLMHLDTFSSTLFHQYESVMPALWKLRTESMYFSNCYCAGTSTLFALESVSHGSVSGRDPIVRYHSCIDPEGRVVDAEQSLFKILRDRYGYALTIFDETGDRTKTENGFKAIMRFYQMHLPDFHDIVLSPPGDDAKYRELDARLSSWKADRTPFVLFVHDLYDIEHLPVDFWYDSSSPGLDMTGLPKALMRARDNVIGQVLAALDRRGLTEETLVVLYGDHGTLDFGLLWQQPEYRNGSFASMTASHVPLLVRNSSFGKGISEQLVSLVDLRATIAGQLLAEGERLPRSGMLFEGVDLARESREYAYVQNKNALQEVFRWKGTPKSYAITDGEYYLSVTAHCSEPGKEAGTEFYLNRFDPAGGMDLMTFFELDGKGAVVDMDFSPMRMYRPWYKTWFSPGSMAVAIRRYDGLRQKLMHYIAAKEESALASAGAGSGVRFTMDSFNHSKIMSVKRNAGVPFHSGRGLRWLLNETVFLFGAGRIGREFKELLDCLDIPVMGFVDNSPDLQGTMMMGTKILSLEAVRESHRDAVVIGCFRAPSPYVERQCVEMGIRYFTYLDDIVDVPKK